MQDRGYLAEVGLQLGADATDGSPVLVAAGSSGPAPAPAPAPSAVAAGTSGTAQQQAAAGLASQQAVPGGYYDSYYALGAATYARHHAARGASWPPSGPAPYTPYQAMLYPPLPLEQVSSPGPVGLDRAGLVAGKASR